MSVTTSLPPTSPNRTRRPIRRSVVAGIVALGMVLAAAACDGAPADCSKDCIDFVSVSASGKRVLIPLNGVAVVELTIYSDAALSTPAGYARNFASNTSVVDAPITKAYQGIPGGTPTYVQLKPDTVYYFRVKATDPKGRVRWETGSFRTWKRTVTVTVDSIELFDDSDLSGSGEITFDMRLNGGASSRIYQNLNMSTGANPKNLNISRTTTTALSSILIEVRGQDDDCTFSTCYAPSGRWDTATNGDVDWATAKVGPLTIPDGSGVGTGGSGAWMGQAGVSAVGRIGFRINGTWSVSYAR